MAGSGKAIPSKEFIDLEQNMLNADKFLNSTALKFTNRTSPNGNSETKTLSGLVEDVNDAIENTIGKSYIGVWTIGVTTFNFMNEYAEFNGITYKPKSGITLPYVAQTTSPLTPPDSDNVEPFSDINSSNIGDGYVTATDTSEPRKLSDRFSDITSPMDFGAFGDGVNDDSDELEDAINNASGKILDGGGKTYRIDRKLNLTSENLKIQNMVIDGSNIVASGSVDKILSFSGTSGAPVSLTSDSLKGSSTISVSSTAGFIEDDWAYLSSDAVFNSSESVLLGQLVRVKSIGVGVVTVWSDILYDFNTSDIAKLTPTSMKKNIIIDNVRSIGSGSGIQSFLDFNLCQDVIVKDSSFYNVDYISCRISRCVNVIADRCTVRKARRVGTSYGFAVHNGSYGVRIQNGYGFDLRHYVTVGDNDGINLFVNVHGNHVVSRDAGIDSHAACDFMSITGNTVEATTEVEGEHDGIIFLGLNVNISNNIVVGFRRFSIFHQCRPNIGVGSTTIDGNTIRNAGGDPAISEAAIYVITDQDAGAMLDGVSITNNVISNGTDRDIYVVADTKQINNVSISGNVVNNSSVVECVQVYALNSPIRGVVVTGNVLRAPSGNPCIFLRGTASSALSDIAITGNVCVGGDYSVRLDSADNGTISGNQYRNYTISRFIIDTDSQDITTDRNGIKETIVSAISNYQASDDDYSICNSNGVTMTVSLPIPSVHIGRRLSFRTSSSHAITSNSSNVIPIISPSTPGLNILPATDGAWCEMISNGTYWQIVKQG